MIENSLSKAKKMARQLTLKTPDSDYDNDEIRRLEKYLARAKKRLTLIENYHQCWLEMLTCIKRLDETETKVNYLELKLNSEKELFHENKDEKHVKKLSIISADLSMACERLQELDEEYSSLLEVILAYEHLCEKELGWGLSRRAQALNHLQMAKI